MGDTEEPITQPQEETVPAPKKPRTQAQLDALESARKKAYAMRAEKSALKKQDEASKAMAKVESASIEAQKVVRPPKIEEDEEEEPEVIYRKKAKKKKRVVVVQEESSSDSEIEVRLPKAKQPIAKLKKPEKNPQEVRYEKAYNRLFSVDTV